MIEVPYTDLIPGAEYYIQFDLSRLPPNPYLEKKVYDDLPERLKTSWRQQVEADRERRVALELARCSKKEMGTFVRFQTVPGHGQEQRVLFFRNVRKLPGAKKKRGLLQCRGWTVPDIGQRQFKTGLGQETAYTVNHEPGREPWRFFLSTKDKLSQKTLERITLSKTKKHLSAMEGWLSPLRIPPEEITEMVIHERPITHVNREDEEETETPGKKKSKRDRLPLEDEDVPPLETTSHEDALELIDGGERRKRKRTHRRKPRRKTQRKKRQSRYLRSLVK